MKKIVYFLIILVINITVTAHSQNKIASEISSEKNSFKTKNFFQVTPLGGFINPMFLLADNFYTSGNVGFEFSYRVNSETAVFFESNFIFLSNKDSAAPSNNYLTFAIGPRYYFRASGLRSSLYFETATGPYIRFTGSYSTPTANYSSSSKFNWGGNAGIGCELVLTNNLYIVLKAKYNAIFSSSGTMSFICGQSGLTIRL